MEPLRFRVWSDYLCPWCYNASSRLRRIVPEYGGRIEIEWRSYLLRPNPAARTPERLEKFRAYTRSWERPAADADAPRFTVWASDEGPPTHSVPAHVVAKAAARIGPDAFAAMHDRLLRAYFEENRDISHDEVLRELWCDAGLDAEAFEGHRDPALREQVLDEHYAALDAGVTGVPAIAMLGNDAVVVGAHPDTLYRTWFDRMLERAV